MVMIKELKKIRSPGLWVLQGSLGVAYGRFSGEGTQNLFVRRMPAAIPTHSLLLRGECGWKSNWRELCR